MLHDKKQLTIIVQNNNFTLLFSAVKFAATIVASHI